MTDFDPYNKHLEFPEGYGDAIAHAANHWASLEYAVNRLIWDLADVHPALGACITSQIQSLFGRLSALLALMKLRHVEQRLIDKINRFAERVREPQELRNRIIHDAWARNQDDPSKMGRIEISAPKSLQFKLRPIALRELRADVQKISDAREAFHRIRLEIIAALPSLPHMSPGELHPVVETLHPRRNRSSDEK